MISNTKWVLMVLIAPQKGALYCATAGYKLLDSQWMLKWALSVVLADVTPPPVHVSNAGRRHSVNMAKCRPDASYTESSFKDWHMSYRVHIGHWLMASVSPINRYWSSYLPHYPLLRENSSSSFTESSNKIQQTNTYTHTPKQTNNSK